MTPAEKVLAVERQVRAMIEGDVETQFDCPFCNLWTPFSGWASNVLCCNEAAEIISAILDHIEHLERVDHLNQVMDRFSGMQARASLN